MSAVPQSIKEAFDVQYPLLNLKFWITFSCCITATSKILSCLMLYCHTVYWVEWFYIGCVFLFYQSDVRSLFNRSTPSSVKSHTCSFRERSQESLLDTVSLCGWLLVQLFTHPVRRPWGSCPATQASVNSTSPWTAALTRTNSPSPPRFTPMTQGQWVQQACTETQLFFPCLF